MIGKPVSSDEFEKVLDREKTRQEFRKQLEDELRGIKKGECLIYEVKEGLGTFAEMSFSLFVEKLGGLKMITEGDWTYIYREK